jgi:hypothetical protein
MPRGIEDVPRIAFALQSDESKRHGSMPIVIARRNDAIGENYGSNVFKLEYDNINGVIPDLYQH